MEVHSCLAALCCLVSCLEGHTWQTSKPVPVFQKNPNPRFATLKQFASGNTIILVEFHNYQFTGYQMGNSCFHWKTCVPHKLATIQNVTVVKQCTGLLVIMPIHPSTFLHMAIVPRYLPWEKWRLLEQRGLLTGLPVTLLKQLLHISKMSVTKAAFKWNGGGMNWGSRTPWIQFRWTCSHSSIPCVKAPGPLKSTSDTSGMPKSKCSTSLNQ